MYENFIWWIKGIIHGLKNLRRWIPIIWYDMDCDWVHLAILMETKLLQMIEDSKGWMVCNADRDRRNMQICVHILARLREDAYFVNARKCMPNDYFAAEHANRQNSSEMKLLGKIIGNHLNHWWD